MVQKLDDSELVTFKELLMANSIQTDALAGVKKFILRRN